MKRKKENRKKGGEEKKKRKIKTLLPFTLLLMNDL